MSFVRRRFAAVRRAPWEAAAPWTVIACAVLVAGFIVGDAGGWRAVFATSSVTALWAPEPEPLVQQFLGLQGMSRLNFSGPEWSVLLLLLVVASAAARRRWLTAVLLLAVGVLIAAWVDIDPSNNLGYVEAELHHVASGSDYDGEIEVAMTMYAVVGLLLAVAFLAALSWAIGGTRARRRGVETGAPSPSRAARIATVAAAVIAALPLPRIGLWLRDLLRPSNARDAFAGHEQDLYLLVFAALVVFAAAVLLPRRLPAVSTAAVTIGAALWFPTLFIISAFEPDSGALVFGVLVVWVLGGLLGGGWIAARAGRAGGNAQLAEAPA